MWSKTVAFNEQLKFPHVTMARTDIVSGET